MSSEFRALDAHTAWRGRFAHVRIGRFRHADGGEVTREWVAHPGAVAMVAHDDQHVWLVRQPREAVGEPDLLELPAGKLDEPGEEPLATAQRELAEEVGLRAERWESLGWAYMTPGFSDERIELFLATELSPAQADPPEEAERIEIVAWPLADLDAAIDGCHDAKTLIGLLSLRRRLRG